MPQLSYSYDQLVAFDGMRGDIRHGVVETWANNEAALPLTFGRFAVYQADHVARRATTITDKIVGAVVHSHADAVPATGEGVSPKSPANMLREGAFWTLPEEAMTPITGAVYVRLVATGDQLPGAVRATPDGVTCVKLNSARVLAYDATTGLAQLEINMLVEHALVASGLAGGSPGADVPLIAGADLSSSQYFFVKVDSSGHVVLAGAGEQAIGVVQNAPASSATAIVRISGITQVITAGTDAAGTWVESDSAGKAKAAVKGSTNTGDAGSANDALLGGSVMGVLLETATANVAHKMLLSPVGAVPTTAS